MTAPVFAPEIESWVYRADGRWEVVTTVGGVETARSVEDGRSVRDCLAEAQAEIRTKLVAQARRQFPLGRVA